MAKQTKDQKLEGLYVSSAAFPFRKQFSKFFGMSFAVTSLSPSTTMPKTGGRASPYELFGAQTSPRRLMANTHPPSPLVGPDGVSMLQTSMDQLRDNIASLFIVA
jgi:hypothetical protein